MLSKSERRHMAALNLRAGLGRNEVTENVWLSDAIREAYEHLLVLADRAYSVARREVLAERKHRDH